MEKKSKNSKPKSVKKTKPDNSKLKLMVINGDNFEVVEVPISLRKNYIDTFGVQQVRTKEELQNWLSSNV